MFNFLNRNKVNIDSVSVPHFGWELGKNDDKIKQWINPEQTIAVSINYFNLKPDIPPIGNIDHHRNYYRSQIVQQNGGLIQVDMLKIKGYDVIKTIFKIPQDPTGMTYLASLTFPFKKFSFVVKIQVPELGMTGVRDSVVTSKLLNLKIITVGENGIDGWSADPYDPAFSEGVTMNKSEAEIYDSEFPEHPLSKARALITQIEQNISFGAELEKASKFKK